MKKFVVRRMSDGKFLRGGRGHRFPLKWDKIENARLYSRKRDAAESIRLHFEGYHSRHNISINDLQILEVDFLVGVSNVE